jgi:hypothetical protein
LYAKCNPIKYADHNGKQASEAILGGGTAISIAEGLTVLAEAATLAGVGTAAAVAGAAIAAGAAFVGTILLVEHLFPPVPKDGRVPEHTRWKFKQNEWQLGPPVNLMPNKPLRPAPDPEPPALPVPMPPLPDTEVKLDSKPKKERDKKRIHLHHIAPHEGRTVYTDRISMMFLNAGLDIHNSGFNIMPLPADEHNGPHPIEYHAYVFEQLELYTEGIKPHTDRYTGQVIGALATIRYMLEDPSSLPRQWLRERGFVPTPRDDPSRLSPHEVDQELNEPYECGICE